MAKIVPHGCSAWPAKAEGLSLPELIRAYEDGFAGAYYDPEEREAFESEITAKGGKVHGEDIAHAVGFAESGAGKLSIPFVFSLVHFPGCLPGAAQDVGDCFAAGTIVCGEDYKPIEEVEIGDRVFMADGSLTKVITKQAKASMKPLVTIKALGTMPVQVTEDHKVLVYRMGMYNKNTRINRAMAEREEARFEKHKALRKRNGKDRCEERSVVAYRERKAEWIKAGDLRNGDYLLSPINREKAKRPGHPLLKTEDGRWLLGYFMGDGYAGARSVEFAVADNGIAERIEDELERIGLSSVRKKYRDGAGAFAVRCNSAKLSKWLRSNFYGHEKQKKMPSWAIGDRDIVQGLLDADGHKSGRVQYFDSVSPSLAYGVQASFIEWGIDATIGKFHRSVGSYPTDKPAYRVIAREGKQKKYIWRDDEYVCFPIESTEAAEGPHVVYDIGVEHEFHAFLANGTVFSNCVSHSEKNANMMTYACEIQAGEPDEVSGKREEAPKIPAKGLKEGAFSTEAFYWWRGRDSHGWTCDASSRVAMNKAGLVTRDNHTATIGVDLTEYSGRKASKYGRTPPPDSVAKELVHNLIRQATTLNSREERRDFLANGYCLHTCGSEGFASDRDENGVSRRRGMWAHAMAYGGFDDRESTKAIYGDSLELVQNSWAIWNSGPRDIRDSASMVPALEKAVGKSRTELVALGIVNESTGNIMIPHGAFWAKSGDISRRRVIAKAGVNGWVKKDLWLQPPFDGVI